MNNETLTLLSNIGLILCIVPVTLHGIEAFFPMQARWITNWVLPFFGAMLPNRDKFLTYDEQIKMLDSALDTVPVQWPTDCYSSCSTLKPIPFKRYRPFCLV